MVDINLLPWREHQRDVQQKQFFILLGAVLFATFIFIVLSHFMIVNSTTKQKFRNHYLKSEIQTLNQHITEIKDLKMQKNKLIARMQVIQQLEANRHQIVRLFDEFVNVIPDGVYFYKINRTNEKMMISGKAESNTQISELMRKIERSAWLKKPVLDEIKSNLVQGAKTNEFKLKLYDAMPSLIPTGEKS